MNQRLLANGSPTMVIDVGTGVAIGVLMDTFLVRTLLVPSAVVLLGRWNWWPSRLSQPAPAHDRPSRAGARPVLSRTDRGSCHQASQPLVSSMERG